MNDSYKIYQGDCIDSMKMMSDKSVQCCVTSPPYFGLRDYGVDGQIGLEGTPDDFVKKLVEVFREVKRVLADDGTLWLNIGDSYAGSGKGPAGNLGKAHNERHMEHTKSSGLVPDGCKPKDLIGIPWMLAFALRADGWYLRQDIIWNKPNGMPEAVKDRCTKSHEYIFLLTKSPKYFYDAKAIEEDAKTKPGVTWSERKSAGATAGNVIVGNEKRNGTQRVVHGKGISSNLTRQDGKKNKRSVWTVTTKPFKGAHFATFPTDLIEPCILAGSRPGDTVLDPFNGAGTTGVVSLKHGRKYIGCELNPEYIEITESRLYDNSLKDLFS